MTEPEEIFNHVKDKLNSDLYPWELMLDRLEEETGEDPKYQELYNNIYDLNKSIKKLKRKL